MDISGSVDAENRDIYMWKFHGGKNQQWDLIYMKDWKGEPTKGEMNEDFGLRVDTDMYIVTHMSRGRYIDVLGRNLVVKTPNGRKTQIFYFH